MSRLLRILRDPVWQSIGALISILAIFISSTTFPSTEGELAVVHCCTVNFRDYLIPAQRVKLLLKGTKQDLDHAVIDYYTVINNAKRPILPTDFTAPLQVVKGAGAKRVFVVDSCAATGLHDSLGRNSYIAFPWTEEGDRWVVPPLLLNPDDQSCVIVISEPTEHPAQANALPVDWQARVANVKLTVYHSVEEFSKRPNRPWSEYILVSVVLTGMTAYWFLILQTVIFVVTLVLARQAGFLIRGARSIVLQLLAVMLLSTSTAEILTDIFINRRGSDEHPIVWPLLFVHTSVLIYFAIRSLRKRTRRPYRP